MDHHDDVPYEELAPNIRSLVQALNTFAGTCLPSPACVRRTGRHRQVKTLGSCGGHPDPDPGQAPEGNWWVTFEVEHSEDGWFALEFLA